MSGVITVAVSVCLFDDISLTSYPIESEIKAHVIFPILGSAYIAAISNKKKKIIAACIFISTIRNPKDPEISSQAKKILASHTPTSELVKKAKSVLVSRLNINEKNGTLEEAFSQNELDKIYTEFYMKHSINGNA
ncbi:negative control protein of sporulation [Erwinia mallotivora]|uniref:negative control protein of sporulation n=1 Tax=Erwinia mallotivora TaxID=69222 RepID=UPI0021C010E4|nr:negative control protein of sporulation [Erwinia mallotivora]